DEQSDDTKTIRVEPVRSADDAHAVLDAERGEMPKPGLTIGMKAPKLEIAKWVKGDSVQHFEDGHTYIVEFWATWCGPCVAAFPHVSEVQKEHADDVTVIGVNIWDRPKDRETGEFKESMEEQITRVSTFVKEQGERMSYTVAIEESGKMAEHWMTAAGQGGIPAAFIVDNAGKVAWIGHPMSIDEPLEEVRAGNWDYKAAAESHKESLEARFWSQHLMGLLADEGTAERGYKLGYALLRTPFANDPGTLNRVAWTVLTSSRIPVRDLDLAVTLASVACEKTDWKDASIIDTLARGYFDKGDHARAIELQTKALKLAEGQPMAEDLEATLEQYKSNTHD
ncbi:MAG: TlpA family protein disulfide reductase, partial [Phycisphaerales bacterium]|nr:TlpA family protein disulfide reductase [Phycisphaerales bacterium]